MAAPGLTVAVVALAIVATIWAFAIRPEPFSDWAYYWEAASGAVAYERGGLLLFALRGLQAMSLPPHAAALALNLPAAAILGWLAHRADGGRFGMAAMLVFAYLLAIVPYYAVVQLDMAATALACAGMCLIAVEAVRGPRPWRVLAAVALVAAAVSSRPQFLLVLSVFAGLVVVAVAWLGAPGNVPRRRAVAMAGVLLAATWLGFGIDSALRADAGRAGAVRTTSGVTLYAGLLSSDTVPPTCGHWNARATHDARADAGMPLLQAVSARLRSEPPRHWLSVIGCKMPAIVLPRSYALGWSLDAPNVQARIQASANPSRWQAWSAHLHGIERLGYLALLAALYCCTGVAVARWARRRQWLFAALPVAWIASFWLVHAVFEIQPRYFLSLFLLLPFFTRSLFTRS